MAFLCGDGDSSRLEFLEQAYKSQTSIWGKVREGAMKLHSELQDVIRERDSLISILGKLNLEKERLAEQVRAQMSLIEELKCSQPKGMPQVLEDRSPHVITIHEDQGKSEAVDTVKIELMDYPVYVSEDLMDSDSEQCISDSGRCEEDVRSSDNDFSKTSMVSPPQTRLPHPDCASFQTMDSLPGPSGNTDNTSQQPCLSKDIERYFTKGTVEYMAMKVSIDDHIEDFDLVSQVSKRDTKLRRAQCIHSILTSLELPRDAATSTRLGNRIQTLVTSRRYEGKIRKEANRMGISPRVLKLERGRGRRIQKQGEEGKIEKDTL